MKIKRLFRKLNILIEINTVGVFHAYC